MIQSVISLISHLVRIVAGCIYNLWRIGMSKSPENISKSSDWCCYGYWKVTKCILNSMKNVHFSVHHRTDMTPMGVPDVILQNLNILHLT